MTVLHGLLPVILVVIELTDDFDFDFDFDNDNDKDKDKDKDRDKERPSCLLREDAPPARGVGSSERAVITEVSL